MTDFADYRTRGGSPPSPRNVACPSAALCNEDRKHLDELKYHVRQRCGILTEKNDTASFLETWNSRRRARPEDKIKEEIEALVKEFPGVEVGIYFEWPLHVNVSLRRSLLTATASETKSSFAPGRIASGLRIFDTRSEV